MPPAAPARFFHDHGYGPQRLAAALDRIDWTRADGLARARTVIGDHAATALALLREVARQRRRKAETLVTELLAAGDAGELALLWLVSRLAAHEGQPLNLTPAAERKLAAAAAPLRAHAQLLLSGELPAARLHELAILDTDTLLELHLQEAQRENTLQRPATIARLLKVAGGGEETSRALTARLRRLQKQLAATAPRHARLDYATFRRLAHGLRAALLFTPALAPAFLDAQALAAARPPSPDFDPLYFDRALADLAAGKLDHLDVDTLVLGADASPLFRARIVQSLAHGVGSLDCSDAVRERLIAASEVPEICLVACAVARHRDDMRRALAHLPQLPPAGVLGEALQRFAALARDGNRKPGDSA